MVAGTLAYPAILLYFTRVEWGPLATAYLGLMMMGAMLLGIGIFASSLTENQIVAALIAFGISLMFWIVSWSAEFAGGPLGTVLTHLSILEHNDTFSKGILDTKDVIYFVDFTALFLFLTLRSLEARRWAG
jgi:ABC-2 type transport system permease protein